MSLLKYLDVSLGQWFGVPVVLHWTWVLLLLFILLMNPVLAVVYVGLFVIVLLHEFGHCLAAMYYQLRVDSITLYPIGGVARIDVPFEPKEELVVTVCGPLVNVILIPVLFCLTIWVPEKLVEIFTYISYINLIMLIFNLLPVFPLDGGRILRAVLAMFTNNRLWATVISGRIGQICSIGFIIYSVLNGQIILCCIGVFLIVAAQGEIEQAKFIANISGGDASEVVDRIARRLREIDDRL